MIKNILFPEEFRFILKLGLFIIKLLFKSFILLTLSLSKILKIFFEYSPDLVCFLYYSNLYILHLLFDLYYYAFVFYFVYHSIVFSFLFVYFNYCLYFFVLIFIFG